MKVPTEITIAFDPIGAGVASFTSKTAKIIYCCIRKQHIVDQYFDAQVFGFAEGLDEDMPEDYEEFKKRVRGSALSVFGTKIVPPESLFRQVTRLDDEFWQGVWKYIIGEGELEIKLSPSVQPKPL